MTDLRRQFTLIATSALLMAACGGGGSATATPNSGLGTVPPSEAAASDTPTAEAAASDASPTSAPSATEPSTGGGALGVCDLATPDELAAIFGVASVTTTVFAGPPDTCSVESDAGDPLVAWSYSTAQSSAVYDAFVADPSSVQVSGIGDKAAFVQNTGLLVLKGSALSVVSVQSGDEELAKKVAAVVAGRM